MNLQSAVRRARLFLREQKRELLRYLVVGVLSVCLDMGLLFVGVHLFFFPAYIAVIGSQAIVLTVNFLSHRAWSFSSSGAVHGQMLRYLTLTGCNYLFSVGTMYVGNTVFEINPYLIRVASIGLSVSWNFLLFKYWVYRGSGTRTTYSHTL